MATYGATLIRHRSDLVTVGQAVAGVEHELITTATRSDGGWEALCLCGKVVETPQGTRRHAEIALENHITTLREWADVAEEVWSGVDSEHRSLERYGLERAVPILRSDLGAVPTTTRALAAYSALLDRMFDKETRDVVQVMEDYITSELYVGSGAYVVRPVVPTTLSSEHAPAFLEEPDLAFSAGHPPAFLEERELAFSAGHDAALSSEHAPAFVEEHDLAFSASTTGLDS